MNAVNESSCSHERSPPGAAAKAGGTAALAKAPPEQCSAQELHGEPSWECAGE